MTYAIFSQAELAEAAAETRRWLEKHALTELRESIGGEVPEATKRRGHILKVVSEQMWKCAELARASEEMRERTDNE